MSTTPVKERPILFSGPMVRAILSGEKTQTRRVVKPQGQTNSAGLTHYDGCLIFEHDIEEIETRCPYGHPGDRFWVRETFGLMPTQHDFEKWVIYQADKMAHRAGMAEDETVHYRPKDPELLNDWTPRLWSGELPKFRPSIHMPRWASRVNLEVTGVRVERLQDISEADALAEGVEIAIPGTTWYRDYNPGKQDAIHPDPHYGLCPDAYASYESLWESINGPESWAANPWVWVVEFRRI